jgi:hypothetical protein
VEFKKTRALERERRKMATENHREAFVDFIGVREAWEVNQSAYTTPTTSESISATACRWEE